MLLLLTAVNFFFHQRYDKDLVIGITQATICLCGYDFDAKQAAGLVEELDTDKFCPHKCCPDTSGVCTIKPCPTCADDIDIYTCGGDYGRISVYK